MKSLRRPVNLDLLFVLFLSFSASAEATQQIRPDEMVQAGLKVACQSPTSAHFEQIVSHLPGSEKSIHSLINLDKTGWRAEINIGPDMLFIERVRPHMAAGETVVRYDQGGDRRPLWMVIASTNCLVKTVRRLDYGEDDTPSALHYLDAQFREVRVSIDLNPPIPPHSSHNGIAVAVVDTGVNYLLPEINSRLSRDEEGRVRGYDFWDLDQRPFDINPIPSPFFPSHHGTEIASVITQLASAATIMPYRFPRAEMSRMGDLVSHAYENGARIVNVSLASAEFSVWKEFRDAVAKYPDLLFVVAAGNDARDIDKKPVYPAAFNLDNLLVVTASNKTGDLVSYANWGRKSVDLIAPAKRLQVTDFDGRSKWVGGSSYAAARVSGLAACLLSTKPDMSPWELRNSLFAKARSIRGGRLVRVGLLPETRFSEEGACKQSGKASGLEKSVVG